MYYYIYMITNEMNGMRYIGKHISKSLDDDYMGSGTTLKKEQEKWGMQHFKKDIICLYYYDKDSYVNENMARKLKTCEDLYLWKFVVHNRDKFYNVKVPPIVIEMREDGGTYIYGNLDWVKKKGYDPDKVSLCCRGKKIAYRGSRWMRLIDYLELHPEKIEFYGQRVCFMYGRSCGIVAPWKEVIV